MHDVFGADGSFGNGIAYAWYNVTGTVPFAAAVRVRVISGVDLYRLASYRRADEQLLAFTAPNWQQVSASGDEMETRNLYDTVRRGLPAPARADDARPRRCLVLARQARQRHRAERRHDLADCCCSAPTWQPRCPPRWPPPATTGSPLDAGLAALHVDIKRSDRTSVFFRSSRFGAFNHSHADQNSIAYVSQGLPLLINAGYYPYYNSPAPQEHALHALQERADLRRRFSARAR